MLLDYRAKKKLKQKEFEEDKQRYKEIKKLLHRLK